MNGNSPIQQIKGVPEEASKPPNESPRPNNIKAFLLYLWNSCKNISHGVFRLSWDPVWNVQLVLFLIGGYIEWLLIAQLLETAAQVGKVKISMVLPIGCAAIAVVHQFLILRNIEVNRDLVRNTSPIAKAIVRLISIMLSVFLLATITGEVPYLVSLLFFKYGPASFWVRNFDFLHIFTEYQSWTNMKFQTLQIGFPFFCKGLFFRASLYLCFSVLVWDFLEILMKGFRNKKYANSQNIPVWCVFLVSDIISLLIWWQFWKVLKIMAEIPLDAYINKSYPEMLGGENLAESVSSHRDWILGLTVTYGIVIVGRVLWNTLSKRKAAEIHKEIV